MSASNPFANAPVLPFDLAGKWFSSARAIMFRHFGVVVIAAALVMLARWQLDFYDRAAVIVLSYLSDALIFCGVYAGLHAMAQGSATSVFSGARSGLKGRWKSALWCSLWGLPAAAVSYYIFQSAPELIKALILTVGINLLGLTALLLMMLAGGFLTFLMSLLPVLAAIHAIRDPHAGFKVAGLWAFRAMRAGWRPLLAVFMAFITCCFLIGGVLSAAYGHLPAAWLSEQLELTEWLSYWYPWPGLMLAMLLFVSMLYPMASDLLQAADVDLSDEIFQHHEKSLHGDQFVGQLWDRLAWALRSIAVLCLLFGLLYGSFFGSRLFSEWFDWAVIIYLFNFVPRYIAKRYKKAAATASVPAAATPEPPKPPLSPGE